MRLPTVSIIVPTYNSEKTLALCLESIRAQDYPRENVELIIADAGSKDSTREIATRFEAEKILDNPLQTGEAGKAVGVEAAENDILALIDSDNILPDADWLTKMVRPFIEDKEIIATEPILYTYRREDTMITRYCALTGMNDPICYFLGNYDRFSYLSNTWTGLRLHEEVREGYRKVTLEQGKMPTIGANGFLIKREMMLKGEYKPYLFDIDILADLLKEGYNKVAKVDVGIIHLYAGNVFTFMRKQKRRILDFTFYNKQGMRRYTWKASPFRFLSFILSCVTVLPLLFQTLKGFIRKPDIAWILHPVLCEVTFFVYAVYTIRTRVFGYNKIADRKNWKGQG